jgi:hypothetical protein
MKELGYWFFLGHIQQLFGYIMITRLIEFDSLESLIGEELTPGQL